MNKDKVLVLFSGGADSVLLIELAERLYPNPPFALMIDYNQFHKEELNKAKEYLKTKLVSNKVVNISNLDIDSALTGKGTKGLYKNVSQYYIPGRNSIFLSIAFSVAESMGIDKIWIGCDWSDRQGEFPDCSQEFIYKLNDLFKISGSYPISVEAPLLGFSKELVLSLLDKFFNVDMTSIYSGYGEHT